MIHYNEPLIRPPAEADSLIFQATLGCSHNRCAFCFAYATKSFKVRPLKEIKAEIELASRCYGSAIHKIFLADGDALTLPTNHLLQILEQLHQAFPQLRRVSSYAAPRNFVHKSVSELRQLHEAGLQLLYVGLESGNDEILKRINKGTTHDEMIELCQKPHDAGMKLSATVILGLGGPKLSQRHAEDTGRLLSKIQPRFASALTLMLESNRDSYANCFADSEWRMLTSQESLIELRTMLNAIKADKIIFRSDHPSNYLSVNGTLQKDKEKMLTKIDAALNNPMQNQLKQEWQRYL
jgi:radical SAM superfamily enzyme YgiQ (UPF0313 family)